MEITQSPEKHPSRAGRRRIVSDDDYTPWTRAEEMKDCNLFWMPVSSFPLKYDEKRWIDIFLTRLSSVLQRKHELRVEVFLQYKCIGPDQVEEFIKYRRKCFTLMGLVRRPGGAIPKLPNADQLKEIVKEGKPFDLDKWVPDYAHWFLSKQPERQRELFMGFGGMTTIALAPDPKSKAPPLPFTPALRAAHPALKRFDIDATHEATYAMSDQFLEKSKSLFGVGLEDEVQYEGLPFILPLLTTRDFFAATPEMRAQWFTLFEVYINESKSDRGMLLAFKEDYSSDILDILEAMRADKIKWEITR